MFQQKNVDGALEKLKEASKIEPKLLTPEAQIARYYAQAGDQKNAKVWIIKALTVAPRDLNTRLVAAQRALETAQYAEAKTQADAAMQLDAKSLDAKRLAGLVALFQKDYPAAELYFESANRQSPSDAGSSNNLAIALIEQKDDAKKQRAVELAEVNVRQYPKWAEAYSTYGWVLYRVGQLEKAENALRQSISIGNGQISPETAYYLARVIADRGGHDADAKQLLEVALKSTAPFAQREEAKELFDKLD
jgi:Tfp pilus assembly protein PilF